jgi:hypothetical protein
VFLGSHMFLGLYLGLISDTEGSIDKNESTVWLYVENVLWPPA